MTQIILIYKQPVLIVWMLLSIVNPLYSQDEPKEKFNLIRLLPNEIKYSGTTDFKQYYNGITISKSIVGFTDKHGFSGDGFNSIYEVGISYNYFNRSHYLSIYPQFSRITWWGLKWFMKSEPLLNLISGKLDYVNIETSLGLFGSISLFALIPTNQQHTYFFGFKIGFDISNYLFLKQGKQGWVSLY